MLALVGCTPAVPGDSQSGSSGPGSESESESGMIVGDGPPIYAYPPVVARGGLIYVVAEDAISQIMVDVGGLPLEPEFVLQTDLPTGLLRMPADAPLGETTLDVRYREGDDGVTHLSVDIVEPAFVDVAMPTGVAKPHNAEGAPRECAYSHTGVAFGDYDGDGAPDLFVGHVGEGGILYRNQGTSFTDVTAAVGLAGTDAVAMANFVDLEGDGDLDLFIGRRGTNRLFENRLVPDGAAAFVDITEAVGLGEYEQRTMGVAFGDYDGDDDLDLYVVNHAFCFPTNGTEVNSGDHLYRNDGGVFVEVSEEMGGDVFTSIGFSASWVDTDRDGDQDLIVINDDVGGAIGQHNGLWRNDGAEGFTDISVESGIGIPGVNGMGLGMGDINEDGFVDLAFSNIGPNKLLLSNGDGTFTDVSLDAGVERGRLPWEMQSITWATDLFDFDNDGDLDVYYSGGRIKGQALIPDAMFINMGGGLFEESTWYSGLADPSSAKAAALADFNRDGVWDLATTAWDGPFRLYQGQPNANHWLDIQLYGRGGNREAVGAIIELEAAGHTQTCFHTNRPSLGAGGETHCHFGLGTATTVDAVRVIWPDGSMESVPPPAVDQRIELSQAG